jgi:hypothetical protein
MKCSFTNLCFLFFYTITFSTFAGRELIQLKTYQPPTDIIAHGTVIPFLKDILRFNDSGKIKFVLDEGDMVKGSIFKIDGSISEYGTLAAKQFTELDEYNYKKAKSNLKIAQLSLANAKIEYIRNKKLLSKNAVSKKLYQKSQVAFLKAEAFVENARQQLKSAKFQIEEASIYATSDGMVSNVYQKPSYWYDAFINCIEITMMNPITINVKSSRGTLDQLDLSRKIIIISPFDDKPITNTFANLSYFTFDSAGNGSLVLVVPNKTYYMKNSNLEDKNIKVVEYPSPVVYFDDQDKTLAIPYNTIYKEKKGVYYVWKVIPSNENNKLKLYKAEKTYVKLNDRIKYYGTIKVVELNINCKLKITDELLWNIPDNLKDGDTLLLDHKNWTFLPGEKIRIKIPLKRQKKGFYIPLHAIVPDVLGNNFIFLENGNKVEVKIIGKFDNFRAVTGKNLTENTKILAYPLDQEHINKILNKNISVN